jgi:hypothetical protein
MSADVTSEIIAMMDQFDIEEHVRLAERHAQCALDLAYGWQPQSLRVRLALGRAQNLLISLLANQRLKGNG